MTIRAEIRECAKLIRRMNRGRIPFWKSEPAGYDLFYKIVYDDGRSFYQPRKDEVFRYKPGSLAEAANWEQDQYAGIYVYLSKWRTWRQFSRYDRCVVEGSFLLGKTAAQLVEENKQRVITLRAHVSDLLRTDGEVAAFRKVEVLDNWE